VEYHFDKVGLGVASIARMYGFSQNTTSSVTVKLVGCLLILQLYSKVVALEFYHLSGLSLCHTSCLDIRCIDLL
jgi:hypothetical protein